MAGSSLSLKGRAIAALARREHSRVELARKLAPHAESVEQIDALLDGLEVEGWLSQSRFIESWVRRRASRLGTQRIRGELAAHALPGDLTAPVLKSLELGEFERAREAWQRRFGEPPTDRHDYARQGRFLAARGFRTDVIHRVLREAGTTVDR